MVQYNSEKIVHIFIVLKLEQSMFNEVYYY